jgi:hypothetical protein
MNHPFPAAGALGDISRHFWLLRSVARSMGLDLGAAMAEGRLSEAEYAAMVTRCRAGGCSGPCTAWLACQQSLAAAPPPGCVNTEELTGLKS